MANLLYLHRSLCVDLVLEQTPSDMRQAVVTHSIIPTMYKETDVAQLDSSLDLPVASKGTG